MVHEFNPRNISIVAGLGNPGEVYANTYHNLGKRLIEILAQKNPSSRKIKLNRKGEFVYFKNANTIFLYPVVFMNKSGIAISRACDFFKCSPTNLLVVHDENDLPFGNYKINFGGRDAGHNGIKSIIESLGTEEFWRLRLGIEINQKNNNKLKAGDFVLSPLSKEKEMRIENLFEKIIEIYFP